ncbi:hypothetical protein FSP39_019250 [Pinctada imbricata]|uniref:Uncharacterized protein n=1 Tax=Pinctada imbricata TaxID=66713 RepID=A0AA88XGB5_PINIB|nr:hypothetical protein FSP39_019250 [Pinctada imbricata]
MLLMPAKTSCPSGWKTEYSGILTTNSDDFHKSEYTCMDNDPEYIEGTRIDNFDGKLFYPVRTVCGSLPCPPYKNGTFVECAVCTK